ncbi:hypothetical protein [Archangium sp.]|jgi:hypothetical protein|uniref:hypothetical protein n=1 Tax=Archangium sp. TaxID=1872627 RepID=UPI002EDAFC05
MRTRALLPTLAALLLAAGCVIETKLQPLPAAETTQSGSAVAEEQGVRLVADGDAWKGTPSHLERLVTPVEVRIENQSGRPLRLQYEEFVLVGGSRFQYAALSPFELRDENLAMGGSGSELGHVALSVGAGVGHGAWSSGVWGPGPFYRMYGWGPGVRSWNDPFFNPWGDPFYGNPYTSWLPPEPLPTRDMLRRALPEGTLEPGGTVTGFLYFQDVSEREGSVTLQARLVDARTGEQFGTLTIPFGVRS